MFNTGVDLINIMFKKAFLEADGARKIEANKLLAYYNDCQFDYIVADIRARYPEKTIFPVGINIIKKIVRSLSMVYLRDAVRSLSKGTKQDAAILSEIETSAAMGVKMKLANRYSKLLGTVLAWPNWRNGHIELDILTGDCLDVETGLSPEDLQAVQITRYDPTGAIGNTTYSLWTADKIVITNNNGRVISEEKNPYSILPFIPIWGSPVTDVFWQRGAADLVMAQDEINRLLTSLSHLIELQGFSVGCLRGVDTGREQVKIGAGTFIGIPKEGDFKFVAPEAPIEQIIAAIDNLIKWTAITSGLSANSISADATEMSGIARLVANAELEEMRRDDIALFAQYEHKLFNTYRVIWNVHNPGRQISASAEFAINFADPRPYIEPQAQIAVWKELMAMGIYSPVDVMQELDPDLNREAAIQRLMRVQADMTEYSQDYIKNPTPDTFTGATITPFLRNNL